MVKTKLDWGGKRSRRRIGRSRSYVQKSFGMTKKRGTDLRMKSQVKPRRIAIKLLSNAKGINVILHGLRPVPINR
jgi:hypothetical protein